MPNNQACALVTSSALCEFDTEPDKGTCFDTVGGELDGASCSLNNGAADCDGGICEQSDQFRLLFSPDVQNWVAYKLNASNPGQFFYNLIHEPVGLLDDVTLTINVPYPFVTQGASPVHVYPGDVEVQDGCFVAEEGSELLAGGPTITIDDWTNGIDDLDPRITDFNLQCDQLCGPDIQPIATCSFDVTIPAALIPMEGQIYVNVHLDYGLKGPHIDANPCDELVRPRPSYRRKSLRRAS